ncbi:NADPH-dependent 7-cyano-7-deazaguanine reductase QueF [Halioxenophilus aromaticivorans]|uniref:NADPH-dependent 7-cyano-7-deazaguanine reductase n=1 Tax=Halioxenophilus aromaticivorans TaxID=1306992 RepID=A0AAV3U6G6_9ALTE
MAHDEHSAQGSGLGKHTDYISQYDPNQLYPIARKVARDNLGVAGKLPFDGVDYWTAWELSWLNANGLPQVAVAEFALPAISDSIIESKSFKLYLNSFNQTRFSSWQEVETRMQADLSQAAGAPVVVSLMTLAQAQERMPLCAPTGLCIDEIEVAIEHYEPAPELLKLDDSRQGLRVSEQLYSNLLKTNCPVTGQPDWATLWLEYTGPAINHASLLAYVVSFREHQDFHEQCVERCFLDIQARLKPDQLSVYARYTRRGGLDINPFRTSGAAAPGSWRLVRQ